MGWTKRQIVEQAFGELALAGYVFDLTAEELNAALLKLDTSMATLLADGVALSYAFGTSPDDTDLDQDSGLPLWAVEAVYKRLAVDLAASKGKQLASSTLKTANNAWAAVLSRIARGQVQQQQLRGGVPLGAGNKWTDRRFTPQPSTEPLQVSDSGELQFLGD